MAAAAAARGGSPKKKGSPKQKAPRGDDGDDRDDEGEGGADGSGGGWAFAVCASTGAVAAVHQTSLSLCPAPGAPVVTHKLAGRQGAVRAAAFDAQGGVLFLAGDDKRVEAWPLPALDAPKHTSVPVSKKIGQLCIAPDGSVIAGDKSGEVFRFTYSPSAGFGPSEFLLGHTASTITGLQLALGGRLLVSSDKDEHIRVSRFPHTHVIEGYCLGHTGFVAALCEAGEGAVASGSGDGSLRVWRIRETAEEAARTFTFEDPAVTYPPTVTAVAYAAGAGHDWVIASVESRGFVALCREQGGSRTWRDAAVRGEHVRRAPVALAAHGAELWCGYSGSEAPLLAGFRMNFSVGESPTVELAPLPNGLPALPFSEVAPSDWQLELERKRRLRHGEGTPEDLKRRKVAAGGDIAAAQRQMREAEEEERKGRERGAAQPAS
eukprot:TRINITY_DN26799_c0_g1_i1.p1 TRINITY_DN26799_c0_g1~~TRINITY_DN26799_c0_g1_i1.p1  ORF type:complete len:458 (+),score=112.22 TRINITY_DN26799_c0_g1_i1:70-1374(+)